MGAEEYFYKWMDKKHGGSPTIDEWTPYEVFEFAESYNQYKVNEITDEEIEKNGNDYAESIDRLCAHTKGIRQGYKKAFEDLKQRLLNQNQNIDEKQ